MIKDAQTLTLAVRPCFCIAYVIGRLIQSKMEKKEQKISNFGTAVYIAENHGHNISDEKLTEVAKAMNLKPKVLIKNYKSVVSINEIVGSLNGL